MLTEELVKAALHWWHLPIRHVGVPDGLFEGLLRWPRRTKTTSGALPSLKHRRRYWGDWHRVKGVWTLWFVLLIAVSGLWYLVEEWGADAGYAAYPASDLPPAQHRLANEPQWLDELVARAQAIYPSLAVRSIRFDAGSGTVVVQGQADAILVRDRANHVVLDIGDGALLDLRRGDQLSVHQRIAEAADPLHFGDLGGSITRMVWFLFGSMLTALSLTGVYLCGLRVIAGPASAVTPSRHGVVGLNRTYSDDQAAHSPHKRENRLRPLICDGSHKGTSFTPVKYIAEGPGKIFFCTCKQTGDAPVCDGSHNA